MTETKQSSLFTSALDQSNKAISEINELKSKPVTATKRNLVFAAICVASFLVIGMIGAQIITGALALLVAALVSATLLYGFRFLKQADPLIQQKTRNMLIKKMTEEAKKNKIETLDNLVIASSKRLNKSEIALKKMIGYVNKMESNIDPASSNADKKEKMLKEVTEIQDQMNLNYKNGMASHSKLKEKVADYKDMHEFSEIASEATAFALGNSDKDLSEMLGLAAFEQIETDFNEAMASVEVMTLKMKLEDEQ